MQPCTHDPVDPVPPRHAGCPPSTHGDARYSTVDQDDLTRGDGAVPHSAHLAPPTVAPTYGGAADGGTVSEICPPTSASAGLHQVNWPMAVALGWQWRRGLAVQWRLPATSSTGVRHQLACAPARRAASSEPLSSEASEYVRPRSPLAQAAWDYQQEAQARLAEDGGITTETAFEILAVRTPSTVALVWRVLQSHRLLPPLSCRTIAFGRQLRTESLIT
jgi:hypothetical protein